MKAVSDTILLAVIVALVIIEVTALILGRDGIMAMVVFTILGGIAGVPIARKLFKR